MKPSTLWFRAEIAAEAALPAESRLLLARHDELSRAWSRAGCPLPVPEALKEASRAVSADPLAAIALEIRQKGNAASHNEWRAVRAGETK